MHKKVLISAPFKIYNASAGSGKTHTLTKAYLKIALSNSGEFKKILAITFTNKAVNEMKNRILNSLYQFSSITSIAQAPALFKDIMTEMRLDVDALRQRSKKTLKEILHNYAFFDVSTIDKFTHRLIRTFAQDLKLPQNFEVVLDNDLLLDEAVARLIYKAGSDAQLTKVLLEFSLEKIDDNKSWDIAFDLGNIGKLLFNETHSAHLIKLKDKSIADFAELKKNLRKSISTLKQQIIDTAAHTLQFIAEAGLENTDFTRSSLPNFLIKIAEGDMSIDFKSNWKQDFENATLYTTKASDVVKTTIDGIHAELYRAFTVIKDGYYQFSFLRNAYKNLVPLTVLNAIQQEVRAVQSENEQLSIAEFNSLISKEIKNQPAPFIYERLGEKYRHYFIDEFQDTSSLQWNNLVPLIGNALESEDMQGRRGSLFLVGDAKQAIYRWRGGRAEQFLNLASKLDKPFVAIPEIDVLPVNYRSHEAIIKFNNEFFTATSEYLNSSLYKDLFLQGSDQKFNSKAGGTVQIQFLEKSKEVDLNSQYCTAVLETIAKVRGKKYSYGSICILVRNNKEGVLLADYLAQEKIPTISSESLLLKSSDSILFLIDVLSYNANGEDVSTAYAILSFLSKEKDNRHHFISTNLRNLTALFNEQFNFDLESLQRFSVYDSLERLIKAFDLAPHSNAHITYFMDFALEVEQREGTGVQAFLQYWSKKKDKLGIAAPENSEAVQIMTIHKAKGLEFPIVIFPFANTKIDHRNNEKKMWLPVDKTGFDDFQEVLISEKKEVALYGEVAAQVFREEQDKMELDAINVLYVALTRAETALYVITENETSTRTGTTPVSYAGFFKTFLSQKELWVEDTLSYTFGDLSENSKTATPIYHEPIQFRYTYKDRPGFNIMTKSGVLWDTDRERSIAEGNLMHKILSLIKTERDLPAALRAVLRSGDLANDELESVKTRIENVVGHEMLKPYFRGENSIENERDIVGQNGRVLRPDRVIITDNSATILDYKTGKPDPQYHTQLHQYADALKDMGYTIDKRLIVYIDKQVVVEEV